MTSMIDISLIDLKKSNLEPVYEFEVSLFPDDYEALFITEGYLVFYNHETTETGLFLADQIEIPLGSIDFVITTIPRYDLPSKLGGLGGLNNSSETIVDGENIFLKKYLHPHYGIETYSLTNFNRKSHINKALNQDKTIFKETMDSGLLAKLIEVNDQYKAGTLDEWLAKA